MGTKLFFIEKPALARCFQDAIGSSSSTFYSVIPYTRLGFAYPDKVSYSLPITLFQPKYKVRETHEMFRREVSEGAVARTGVKTDIPEIKKMFLSDSELNEVDFVRRLIDSHDEIILMGDPDHSFYFAIYQLLEIVVGPDWRETLEDRLKIVHLYCLTNDEIIKSWENRRTLDNHSFGEECYQYGLTKRYFEYNFNIYSNLLFRKYFADQKANITMTKYMLQALYLVRKSPQKTEGQLIKKMDNHAGSGRYQNEKMVANSNFGSVASRVQILENLISIGLLARDEKFIHLTPRAILMLDEIHPRCFDPDLHFRVEKWCHEASIHGFETQVLKIDKYLSRFFGRIIRKFHGMGNKTS